MTKFDPKELLKSFLLLIIASAWAMVVLAIWTPMVFAFVQIEIKMWYWIAQLFQ